MDFPPEARPGGKMRVGRVFIDVKKIYNKKFLVLLMVFI
jgi:hypothetical protein